MHWVNSLVRNATSADLLTISKQVVLGEDPPHKVIIGTLGGGEGITSVGPQVAPGCPEETGEVAGAYTPTLDPVSITLIPLSIRVEVEHTQDMDIAGAEGDLSIISRMEPSPRIFA